MCFVLCCFFFFVYVCVLLVLFIENLVFFSVMLEKKTPYYVFVKPQVKKNFMGLGKKNCSQLVSGFLFFVILFIYLFLHVI